MKNAQIHRFRDTVAVSLPGTGQTVYMTAKQARQLAKAMNACARDISARGFAGSQCTTTVVPMDKPE